MSDRKASLTPGSGRSPLRPFLRPGTAVERSAPEQQPTLRVLRPFVPSRAGAGRPAVQESPAGSLAATPLTVASPASEARDLAAGEVPSLAVEAPSESPAFLGETPDIALFAPDPVGASAAPATHEEGGDPSSDAEPVVVAAGAVREDVTETADLPRADSMAADLAWLTESAAEPFVEAAVEEIDPTSDPADSLPAVDSVDSVDAVATVATVAPVAAASTIAESLRRVAQAVEDGRIVVPSSDQALDDAAALAAVLATMLLRPR